MKATVFLTFYIASAQLQLIQSSEEELVKKFTNIGECYAVLTDNSKFAVTFNCVENQVNFFDSSESSVLECSNERLAKYDVVNVDFKNCSMEKIDVPICDDFKQLQTLNASGMELKNLQKNILQGAKNLVKIDLSHNLIEIVPELLFVNTGNLKEVDFSSNYIYHINELAFVGNLTIEVLDLSNNSIGSLERHCIEKLSRLRNLNLSNNNLRTLVDRVFDNATMLEVLDLSFNNITQLDVNVFAQLIHLKHLNISHMHLSSVAAKMFCHQTVLESLDLSHNNLKVLDVRVFDGGIFLPRFDHLHLLLIGGNQLVEMSSFTSAQFPNVTIFGIANNQFECCSLEKMFRVIGWRQLDLKFEQFHHPNITDANGVKCKFGDQTAYGSDKKSFGWNELLMTICIFLLSILFGMVIALMIRDRGYAKTIRAELTNKNSAAKDTANNNFYEMPKY